jgi:hypothetical protein
LLCGCLQGPSKKNATLNAEKACVPAHNQRSMDSVIPGRALKRDVDDRVELERCAGFLPCRQQALDADTLLSTTSDHAVRADDASSEAPCGHYCGPIDQTAHGIWESRSGKMRIYVSENVGGKRSSGCGQAISAVHSFPEVMVKRKLCSLTIAATRLKPSPSPPLPRLLSER